MIKTIEFKIDVYAPANSPVLPGTTITLENWQKDNPTYKIISITPYTKEPDYSPPKEIRYLVQYEETP